MHFFDLDKKLGDSAPVLPISIRSAIMMRSNKDELKVGYSLEHERNHLKAYEELLREDTLNETEFFSFGNQRLFKEMAEHELNQLGHIPGMLSEEMIEAR